MNDAMALSYADELRSLARESGDRRTGLHEAAFRRYREIEEALSAGSEPQDAWVEAQSAIIRVAAETPALTMRDAIFKLALWRWDAPNLDDDLNAMTRYDAAAYAAFVDLANLLPEHTVLKDVDPQIV